MLAAAVAHLSPLDGAASSRVARAPAPWFPPPSRRQQREDQPPREGESRFIKTKRALVKFSDLGSEFGQEHKVPRESCET